MADASRQSAGSPSSDLGEAAYAFLYGGRTVRGFGALVSAYDIKTAEAV